MITMMCSTSVSTENAAMRGPIRSERSVGFVQAFQQLHGLAVPEALGNQPQHRVQGVIGE